ncbi:aminopeptidase N [Nitratireductor aquibiodomus]|uniref:Aminopeptidase N n=1 Tax=Nitratireductor aquibiodomus TaxID=204799 RepID=A0A1H4NAX2_9HYPH|nr:aminopeptidase N [Nitratireductor aquibiodomus]SEB92399.1 aminopeptidase N [Nitratireductor aquibiodomus]
MRTESGQIFRLEDYQPSNYLIPEVALDFQLNAEETLVTARLQVERIARAPADAPLILDGDGLVLEALAVNGTEAEPADYDASPDRLTISRLPASRRFELTIVTRIAPSKNTTLMGLYVSSGVFCTQCEAEGFRRITYFLDRPDILSVYTVRMEADRKDAPLLLSNGNPVESGDLADGRHFAVWHDPFPKPSYLFALVAGDLGVVKDRFTTASGREVDLGIYVEHGKEKRAAYAMDALKRSMRWDEERFGREYDLDVFNIVAVSDFNMGAMENKGLNVFNDKYVLADEDTATDVDFANIEAIIAHEYFHNWTGNRITCRDWFQLCLKEGLTVFRDHEFSADERSRAVKRIAEVRGLRAHQFPEDQGPLAHPVRPRRYREINNFYTATVYEKGSEVVRMLRTILGEDAFRAGMDLYFERHDGQAVTIEDFVKAFEDASGRDLSQFSLWYHQAGTPNVALSSRYDGKEKALTVEIEQSVPPTPSESRKRLMHIPLAFGLVGPDGIDLDYQSVEGASVENGVIHLRKRRHQIVFKGVKARPVLSINRGFSAPVTLSVESRADEQLFLARHDSDPFSRWQALNTLLTDALIAASKAVRGGKKPVFEDELISVTIDLAADETLEEAFRALILSVPGEADVAREIGRDIDPDAIHTARGALLMAIAQAGSQTFRALYERLLDNAPFSPDARSAGRRALRNTLIEFLALEDAGPEAAYRQFEDADNMTERAGALTVLAQHFHDTDVGRAALAAFEKRYRDNPLVLDKWFQIQAMIPSAATVSLLRSLMEHPHFSLANPNRVRALVGTFSMANQTAFHSADGEGYRLVAETVAALDSHNPQVAARLATAFRSWRSLEKGRREHARKLLAEMAKRKDLSRDLADILERTLA